MEMREQMRAATAGEWDRANKTGPLWGANREQPSESHGGETAPCLAPLISSRQGQRPCDANVDPTFALFFPIACMPPAEFGLWPLIHGKCKPIRKRGEVTKTWRKRETLKWNRRKGTWWKRSVKESRGDLKSNSNWEDRERQREGGDSGIKRGRRCLVMLGWATTGGFSQPATSSHPLRRCWDCKALKLEDESFVRATLDANLARWQTSPITSTQNHTESNHPFFFFLNIHDECLESHQTQGSWALLM